LARNWARPAAGEAGPRPVSPAGRVFSHHPHNGIHPFAALNWPNCLARADVMRAALKNAFPDTLNESSAVPGILIV
jgi:hypothetical protein